MSSGNASQVHTEVKLHDQKGLSGGSTNALETLFLRSDIKLATQFDLSVNSFS